MEEQKAPSAYTTYFPFSFGGGGDNNNNTSSPSPINKDKLKDLLTKVKEDNEDKAVSVALTALQQLKDEGVVSNSTKQDANKWKALKDILIQDDTTTASKEALLKQFMSDQLVEETVDDLLKVGKKLEQSQTDRALLDRQEKLIARLRTQKVKAVSRDKQIMADEALSVISKKRARAIVNEEEEQRRPVEVEQFANDVNRLLERALYPIERFAGQVNVYMKQNNDSRNLYVFDTKNTPIHDRFRAVLPLPPDCMTIDAYIEHYKNIAGVTFWRQFLEFTASPSPPPVVQKKVKTEPKPIEGRIWFNVEEDFKAQADLYDERVSARRNLARYRQDVVQAEDALNAIAPQQEQERQSAVERLNAAKLQLQKANRLVGLDIRSAIEEQFAPVWAFELISFAIMRQLLNDTCISAMEAAWSQVQSLPGKSQVTMKELIMSSEVFADFAYLTAAQYAYMGEAISSRTSTTTREYSMSNRYVNVSRASDIMAYKVMTCMSKFEECVFRSPNPTRTLFRAQCERHITEMKAELAQLIQDNESPQKISDARTNLNSFEKKMAAFEKFLPEYELVVR
jgi:hypothetical protein